ncbi:hypothetical protein C2I36_15025 [Rhodobacteraceae bacterium WD3A24]|nr:hypothetical protein C2I36_15025 [Rhodobacteraceae bacterium WD3A24]
MNAPRSLEGEAVWRLTSLLEGQLRVVPGAVVGFDMAAALAAADALGIDRVAVVELLPVIEAQMVTAVNKQMQSGRNGQ